MRTEKVTKTVKIPLATSNRKNERVRKAIDEWQKIAGRMNELMPSLGPQHWRSQDSTLFRVVNNEFPDTTLRSHDAYQAAYKVAEAWGSWHSNSHQGKRPQFGDGEYARFCHCGVEVVDNDSGYGVKIGLEPYKPEWWRATGGEYQREYLNKIATGDLKTGSAELHLNDDSLVLHLSVTETVDVLEWGEVEHTVGVDLGERTMWTAVVSAGDTIKQVEMQSGREYRHHREQIKRKRERFMESGDRRKLLKARNQYYDYTDHITHTASKRIVDLAIQFSNSGIVIEDLSHYRETASDAIHDWPYAEMQTKIAYKATQEGVPVAVVDAANTSTTCRKCGHESPANRHESAFQCRRCGYEVHADVNAAVNISGRA